MTRRKKTRLSLDKTTIALLATTALAEVVGGQNINTGQCTKTYCQSCAGCGP